MKVIRLSCFLALLLTGCSSLPGSPVATPSHVLQPVTPTDWLPYNSNYSAQGGGEFTATLPIRGTEKLSQLDISRKLFEIYLGHYRSPELGGLCRLEDFTVEHVDDQFANLAGEQKVEFISTVEYSVQVAEAPTDWAAGNGELSAEGWILHKFLIVGVTKRDDEYALKLIGTGP